VTAPPRRNLNPGAKGAGWGLIHPSSSGRPKGLGKIIPALKSRRNCRTGQLPRSYKSIRLIANISIRLSSEPNNVNSLRLNLSRRLRTLRRSLSGMIIFQSKS
jgi:hypothetical protein